MTFDEYQVAAMRTCSCAGGVDKLVHGVFGLNSEAGEVSGIMQKVYQGHNINSEHLMKELGDCMWMIAEICTSIGCTIEEVCEMNIEKLQKRYPDGFSADKSLHRAENDI